ncbi:MAG: DNA polymerase/3'-5' exonuclease PolX [Pirellulales bacterium]
MNNSDVSNLFDELGDLLEFQGANPFRVRAYRNAARTLKDLGEPLTAIVADPARKLTDIQGIGDDLADKIVAILTTGKLPQLEELRVQTPASVMALLRIPGLGPKKAAVLFKELGIQTLDQLREACQDHRVQALKGFGKKTEETILAGLPLASQAEVRLYWADADVVAQSILAHLRSCPSVEQLEIAGSYRRGRETVGDLDVLAVSSNPAEVMDRFAALEGHQATLARGETRMAIRMARGLQVDLRVVPAESFGAALQYFTGSKAHNVVLRGMAKDRGLKINEYGVYRGEERIAGATEADVYAALELPCFPPELREARQEFAWAAAGQLPKLLEMSDLQGDLHMHTTDTDGRATLEEMCLTARERGLHYIAITDHSKRVTMARGLDGARLFKQWDEIDRLNAKLDGFRVLKGVEVDILERGGLDLPDEVLVRADWVVASVHYGQNQPREQITERIVGALENPYVSAIAHPTGRLINRRKPYEVDLEAVFLAARRCGKLMELNANPARLDLDDVACAAARRHGIPIVISTDAHSTEQLGVMRYGVIQARRAGLTKADVANTRSWPALKKLIGQKPR